MKVPTAFYREAYSEICAATTIFDDDKLSSLRINGRKPSCENYVDIDVVFTTDVPGRTDAFVREIRRRLRKLEQFEYVYVRAKPFEPCDENRGIGVVLFLGDEDFDD